jgi:hypothetical protein
MISVLKKLNFGETFIRWIKLLYNMPLAKLKVNGWISGPICLPRGIRQGCPISAMLFILCTEMLATAIITNKDIQGLKIPTEQNNNITEQKWSQYADDTSILLKDENQIANTIETISSFSSVSGLTLNIEKTEAMWLGSFKNRKDKPFGFQWPKVIRYLGVYIGYDTNETNQYNWINKLEIFQKTLDCWHTRDLTIFGKMVIVKTLGLAKLIFSATMLPLPKNIGKHLETEIDRFIWKGKKRRITKEILHGTIAEGGLGQLDIQAYFEALKASWLPRIFRNENQSWNCLSRYYFNQFGKNFAILNFNFINKTHFPHIEKLPLFYQEIVIAINKTKSENKPSNKKELLNSIIWGNRHLVYENKVSKIQESLYNKHWIECEIMMLGQIVSQNGELNIESLSKMVVRKTDFISTQSKILNALKIYKHLFTDDKSFYSTHINTSNPLKITTPNKLEVDISKSKSKFFYQNIIGFKEHIPKSLKKWMDELECEINLKTAFENKVKSLTDKKLAAFGFKLLHKILICGETLFKWKKIESHICSLCKKPHTVKHMLWECENARYTWSLMNNNIILELDLMMQ